MAFEAQRKVQSAIQNLMEDLDRSYLRKMQGDMHRCAAKCCDDNNTSLESVHGCITKCSENIGQANNYVQNELSNFQRRLERCALDCQDKIRDKVDPAATQDQMEQYKGQYEDCVYKCVDTNIHNLPSLTKKMKDAMKNGHYSGTYL